MDPRVLHAAIDPPRWWQKQREVVAKIETVIDLSAHALGDCEDPLETTGIRIVSSDKRPVKASIVEQHGIRGLALSGKCELQLPNPVDQVDILIAHFGRPPTIKARGQDKQVITRVADDRPRQVELMRLIGREIDRVDVNAPDGASLVQIAFPGHTRGGTSSRASKQAGSKQSAKKASVKKK
jgi:hypothetical protein